MNSPAALTPFERTMLHRLLDGDHPALDALRGQVDRVSLKPGRAAIRCEPPRFVLSDIVYQLEGCENGGTAALFVENGELDSLELYTWSRTWPADPRLTSITYVSSLPTGTVQGQRSEPMSARDMEFLERQISSSTLWGGV